MIFGFFNQSRSTVANQEPGYTQTAYIACMEWLAQVAETYKDDLWIDGEHEFLPDLGFIRLYALPKSVEVEAETNGDLGALNVIWKPKLFIPGDSAQLQAMIEDWKNEDFLLHVQDIDLTVDHLLQFGNSRVPCRILTAKHTSGNVYDGRKGWEIEMIATTRYNYTPGIASSGYYVLPPYVEGDYIS